MTGRTGSWVVVLTIALVVAAARPATSQDSDATRVAELETEVAELRGTVAALSGSPAPLTFDPLFGPVCENHPDDPLYTFIVRHQRYPLPTDEQITAGLSAVAYRATMLSEGVCKLQQLSVNEYELRFGQVGMPRLDETAADVARLLTMRGNVEVFGFTGPELELGTDIGNVRFLSSPDSTPDPAKEIILIARASDVWDAYLSRDQDGQGTVLVLELTADAMNALNAYAVEQPGPLLYISLDYKVAISASLSGPITGEAIAFYGVDEVEILGDLLFALRVGELPMKFEVEEVASNR